MSDVAARSPDPRGQPALGQMPLGEYLGALASKQPVPGGGASAAVTLAQAAALGSMVLEYTVGKPAFQAHAALHEQARSMLAHARTEALALADQDARAYATLNALWSLAADRRSQDPRWAPAVAGAIAAPASIADLACAVIVTLDRLQGNTSRMLASDLRIARLFAAAGLEAALANVDVNIPLMADDAAARAVREDCARRRAVRDAHPVAPSTGS